MEIRITQCSTGRFNLLSNEKTFSFNCAIFDDEGNVVKDNDVEARLHYSGEVDEKPYFEELSEMEHIFSKCFEYATNIWSTRDYKAEALTFAKTYMDNYEELNANLLKAEKKRIEAEIERLKERLDDTEAIPDISYSVNHDLNKEIDKARGMVEYYNKQQEELKPDSESYAKNAERIEDYEKKIRYYESFKIRENV